ncbi:hypothetical protein JOF53_005521 [Crossiella equi]|uniref:Ankyrin repeats (3 copies) n=1 Tax=Crossiella equi TaxID=130796 RepID=A0ABS5AKB0_9PSEU|nr:hypothetical protein [Crossiella equi]
MEAGADPNARLWAIGNTPLHCAAQDNASAEVIDLLVSWGAEAEARNAAGETPLWLAVRHGCGRAVAALLAHDVRPWEPVREGRSAGEMALHGDLAPLFADLPGARALSERERARQAEADALIRGYEELGRLVYPAIAFVGGVDLDTVIRRMGADPADCPEVGPRAYEQAACVAPQSRVCWAGAPAGGGVVVVQLGGIIPVGAAFSRAVSACGATVTSHFDNPAGGCSMDWWRDGQRTGFHGVPQLDPVGGPEEAWYCRFGDGATDLGPTARCLALMGMLTGVRTDGEWLAEAPKRLVSAVGVDF